MFKQIVILLIFSNFIYSQSLILSGKVYDNFGNPIQNAKVLIEDLNIGSSTDRSGFFQIEKLPPGNFNIVSTHLGYEKYTREILITKSTFVKITLKPKPVLIGETFVIAERGKTPYVFNDLKKNDFEKSLGAKEAVYALLNIPSIYISPQGGGVGDLRLNIRGFGQTNIAVMIDGVPVNNPENGEVYWTNWAGMSDIINEIQVQRGIGFVPYSISSVGGNVNFITNGNEFHEFIKFSNEFGSNNFSKQTISFGKNLNDNIYLSSLISKKEWDGYADKTWLEEYTYFFSLNAEFGKHVFKVNLYGSPQSHGQRLTMHSINFWKTHGSNFNSDWGYLNGKPLNLRDNVFHKPTISISHQWNISERLIQKNIIYYSYGEGGGTVPSWTEFDKTESDLIDFDKEYKTNSSNVDSNFHPSLHYSNNALRFTVHKHFWSGLISSFQYKLNNFYLAGGFDFKNYSAENYRKIENLLGGDYTLFSSNINRPVKDLLFVGDKVDYNADSFTRQLGAFIYSEYQFQNLTTFLNLSLSNTGYKRIDYFNYKTNDPKRETDWKTLSSYSLKAGLNYNLESNNIYFNIGYITKPPLSENVFDYSNNLYSNIINEKIFNTEAGYNFTTDQTTLKINFFLTQWNDKAFSQTIQDLQSGKFFFTNITGGSARHKGIEVEARQFLTEGLLFAISISINDNKWIKNIDAIVAPESNPNQQTKVQSFIKNTYVGGFPMQIIFMGLKYKFNTSNKNEFYINPVFNFYGNHYSQFNPNNRTLTNGKAKNSWKIPDYFLADIHLGYSINNLAIFIKRINFSFDVFNIFDRKDYILDALDGINHDSNSALVWMGRERFWHFKTTFNF